MPKKFEPHFTPHHRCECPLLAELGLSQLEFSRRLIDRSRAESRRIATYMLSGSFRPEADIPRLFET
jgi:hypothetical protein